MAQSSPPSTRDALLSRRVAWDVLEAVAAGAYADVALERALRRRSRPGPWNAAATADLPETGRRRIFCFPVYNFYMKIEKNKKDHIR